MIRCLFIQWMFFPGYKQNDAFWIWQKITQICFALINFVNMFWSIWNTHLMKKLRLSKIPKNFNIYQWILAGISPIFRIYYIFHDFIFFNRTRFTELEVLETQTRFSVIAFGNYDFLTGNAWARKCGHFKTFDLLSKSPVFLPS